MKERRRDLIYDARRRDPVCRQIHHANDVRLFGIRDVRHGVRSKQSVRRKQARGIDVVPAEQLKRGCPHVIETAEPGTVARAVGLGRAEVQRTLSKARRRRMVVGLNELNGIRVDPGRGDAIVWESLAGLRVGDGAASGEVAGELGSVGHSCRARAGILLNPSILV